MRRIHSLSHNRSLINFNRQRIQESRTRKARSKRSPWDLDSESCSALPLELYPRRSPPWRFQSLPSPRASFSESIFSPFENKDSIIWFRMVKFLLGSSFSSFCNCLNGRAWSDCTYCSLIASSSLKSESFLSINSIFYSLVRMVLECNNLGYVISIC